MVERGPDACTGIAVNQRDSASWSIVRECAWLGWPKRLRDIAYKARSTNPLTAHMHVWLKEYSDTPDFQFVWKVLACGAPICCANNRPTPHLHPDYSDVSRHNHPSMRDPACAADVETTLSDEIAAGILIPFPLRSISPSARSELTQLGFFSYLHRMGAVPKLDGTERVGTRIIQDYSFPRGNAVNEHIDFLLMQFDKLETASVFITAHPGCFAAKVDISGFFRHLPADPSDWPLTVALWEIHHEPTLLIDTRMPFGLRHAPEVCCRFSGVVMCTLKRMIKEAGVDWGTQLVVMNVVDDWLVLATSEEVCEQVWRMLLALLKRLGFKVNDKKSVGPRQEIGWLGLIFRTNPEVGPPTVELPADKLRKCKAMLQQFLHKFKPSAKRSCTRHELDKLIGFLSFCSTVVYGGRAFLHRIRHLRYGKGGERALSPHLHVHLDVEFRADVLWWLTNVDRFNGQRPLVVEDDRCLVMLDATGNGGLGVFVDGAFVGLTPEEARRVELSVPPPASTHANEWECYNVAVMLKLFGSYLANRSVVIWCDNQCTVGALRKFAIGKASAAVMASIVRCIF